MNDQSPTNESQQGQGGHDVPLTPPPTPPVQQTPPSPRESSGSGARAAAIAIAAVGGVVLLAAGGNAAFAAVHDVSSASRSESADTRSADADGVTSIRVDVSASDVTTRFGDVDEATLELSGSRSGDWRLDREGDQLIVRSPDRGFGSWFGGDWFGRWFDDDSRAVLTLPESLEGDDLDAEFSLSAGSLEIEGSYGEVGIDIGAGDVRMEGSATSIDTDVSAGRADLVLADVESADFSLSAGDVFAELVDTAPQSVRIDVSAGSLELTVPDETYSVTQDVSAGSLDNGLNTSVDSRNKIDATISAGSAILRAGD